MTSETQNSSQPKMKSDKFFWTDQMDSIMLDTFLEHLACGRRTPSGWKKDVTYVAIIDAINNKLGIKPTINHIESRVKTMRQRTSSYKKCKSSQSGFGYDYDTGRLVADPLVWDALIKEDPKNNSLKEKVWPRLMEWMDVLGDHVATGNIQRTAATREEDVSVDDCVDPLLGEDGRFEDFNYSYETGSQYTPPFPSPNSTLPNTGQPSKLPPRKRKSTGIKEEIEGIKGAISEVANAMTEKVRHDDMMWDQLSTAIYAIEDLDEDTKVDALDLFSGDNDKKRCFLKIPIHKRRGWILKICTLTTRKYV